MILLRTILSLVLALQTPIMGTGQHKTFPAHGTQGPFNAGTVSDAYTNSANAKACDSAYATVAVAQGSNGASITLTNFNFAIPTSATIAGITATVHHEDISGNGGIKDLSVFIVKGGSATGTNMASGTLWSAGSPQTFTYGSTSNLWGTTWAVSDINSSNFGLFFAPKNTDNVDGTATVGVDCVTLTVTY